MGPIAPLLIGAGAGLLGNIFSARQANRFSERMSSSAHQREVADLRAAGLNPMLSAGRGASAPQGASPDVTGGASRGVEGGLAVQQAKAQIELLRAQAENLKASTRSTTSTAMRTEALAPLELALLQGQVSVTDLDAAQRRSLLPFVISKVRSESVEAGHSAQRMKALAEIERLAVTGSVNLAKFEAQIGTGGRWSQILLQLLRSVR